MDNAAELVQGGELAISRTPIEHLSETDQDVMFEQMIREYAAPSPEVIDRFAEIGKQMELALEENAARKFRELSADGDIPPSK